MKKILIQIDEWAVLAILFALFFPWLGLTQQSAIEILVHLVQNITTLASIDIYAIAVIVIFSVVSIVTYVVNRGKRLYGTIVFIAVIVAVVSGIVQDGFSYLDSMHSGYMAAFIITIVELLERFGILKIGRR